MFLFTAERWFLRMIGYIDGSAQRDESGGQTDRPRAVADTGRGGESDPGRQRLVGGRSVQADKSQAVGGVAAGADTVNEQARRETNLEIRLRRCCQC